MKIEHTITGLDGLINKLSELSNPDVVNRVVTDGLLEGARLIQATAKMNCHVDTGQLRNSIEVTETDSGVNIGSNVPQAIFEEYGTGKNGDPAVEHTTKDKWVYMDDDGNWHTTSGHEPHPFLYPALKTHQQDVVNKVREKIKQKISEG